MGNGANTNVKDDAVSNQFEFSLILVADERKMPAFQIMFTDGMRQNVKQMNLQKHMRRSCACMRMMAYLDTMHSNGVSQFEIEFDFIIIGNSIAVYIRIIVVTVIAVDTWDVFSARVAYPTICHKSLPMSFETHNDRFHSSKRRKQIAQFLQPSLR